jgi:transcriptional regulator with XRE-family HTH domain
MDDKPGLRRIYLDGRPLQNVADGAGVSNYQLAKALGCDLTLPSKIWRGDRSISYEMAQAACLVLGVSFAEIFGPQLAAIGLQPIEETAHVG